MNEQNQKLLFGVDFINDHAGRLIRNVDIALVEIVANSWDAGATHVEICWPEEYEEEISVSDNGTGMSRENFFFCWNHINYNRADYQGRQVKFPHDTQKKRIAYGSNGKGRHSMFFFNDEYWVETWQEGTLYRFHITKSSGERPWDIKEIGSEKKQGSGTKIYTKMRHGQKSEHEIRYLLGSKFIADPEFIVSINGDAVVFEEITEDIPRHFVAVDGFGDVEILKIQAEKGRTAKQHGLAWWVNNRLVGVPGWETLEDHLLDARRGIAKSLTFIIIADMLEPKIDISADWSHFLSNERTLTAHKAVSDFIRGSIQEELKYERKERKIEILKKNRFAIENLSQISRKVITSFIDEIQLKCPTLKDQDLDNTATLLINLEKSRSGYAFLEKMSSLKPEDLDGWNSLIEDWAIDAARKVLDELKWRLELIVQLEEKVDKKETDELHELQPLFEKGLWIFGPEYEDISFRSNKTISTVIKSFFGDATVENPRIRPDFVALPDASLGAYSSDSYDDNGEIAGYAKIAIVELKRGGFEITGKEMFQARDYAFALKRSGKVQENTQILCFVLGSKLKDDAKEPMDQGNIKIIPRPYNIVLRQAHARTFNLLEKISELPKVIEEDEDLRSILKTPLQKDLFVQQA